MRAFVGFVAALLAIGAVIRGNLPHPETTEWQGRQFYGEHQIDTRNPEHHVA